MDLARALVNGELANGEEDLTPEEARPPYVRFSKDLKSAVAAAGSKRLKTALGRLAELATEISLAEDPAAAEARAVDDGITEQVRSACKAVGVTVSIGDSLE
jgi:hypothetical protein